MSDECAWAASRRLTKRRGSRSRSRLSELRMFWTGNTACKELEAHPLCTDPRRSGLPRRPDITEADARPPPRRGPRSTELHANHGSSDGCVTAIPPSVQQGPRDTHRALLERGSVGPARAAETPTRRSEKGPALHKGPVIALTMQVLPNRIISPISRRDGSPDVLLPQQPPL